MSVTDGELTLHGRIMPASNATFVGEVDGTQVVYKPIAGERPLWDFPDGSLAHREVAAYSSPRRSAGTWCPGRSCGKAHTAAGWCRCGASPTSSRRP